MSAAYSHHLLRRSSERFARHLLLAKDGTEGSLGLMSCIPFSATASMPSASCSSTGRFSCGTANAFSQCRCISVLLKAQWNEGTMLQQLGFRRR